MFAPFQGAVNQMRLQNLPDVGEIWFKLVANTGEVGVDRIWFDVMTHENRVKAECVWGWFNWHVIHTNKQEV